MTRTAAPDVEPRRGAIPLRAGERQRARSAGARKPAALRTALSSLARQWYTRAIASPTCGGARSNAKCCGGTIDRMRATDLILFTPGPVRIPPLVAEYLAHPPCNYHRQDAFCAMFAETERDLKRLVGI